MCGHGNYEIIKKIVSEGNPNLEFLKNELFHEIGSTRRLDQIHTISDLLDCLERSDYFNEDNVKPLKKMTENQQLLASIDAYQSSRPQVPMHVNLYQEERLAEELQHNLHIRAPPQHASSVVASAPPQQNYVTSALFTVDKRAAVFKKISEQLGRSWRDLGRKLNVSEGAMDEIEDRYPRDLKSRILHLLKMAEEDECHDPRQFLKRLCRGLCEAGRNDLRTRVEEIMSQ